jgi:hypothetical protein
MVQGRYASQTLSVFLLLVSFALQAQTRAWKNSSFLFLSTETSFEEMDSLHVEPTSGNWLKRKFFYEHFLVYRDTNLIITLDPVLDGRLSLDTSGNYYQNTRGFLVFANYDDRLLFQSEFYETQATYPGFLKHWLNQRKIIPGAVEFKPFKENGFDFGIAYSRLALVFLPQFTFFLAYDKIKLSPGLHNLWLDDAAMPFPQTGFRYKRSKFFFQYTIATFYNPDFTGALQVPGAQEMSAHQKKWASYHFMTYDPFKFLKFYFFESIVLPPNELKNASGKYLYILPFPGIRLAFAPDSLYGKMLGLGWQTHLKNFKIYSTYAFSRKTKGVAAQAGLCYEYHRTFTHFISGMEYSQANGTAYTNSSSWTDWHNLDFPLGHPLGNAFKHQVFRSYVEHKRWYLYLQAQAFQQALSHRSFLYPLSDSLFEPANKGKSIRAEFGFFINPASKLAVFVSPWWEMLSGTTSKQYFWLQLGIAHRLRNDWFNYW